ncbi:MAG: hypothetical protein GOU99_02180, partial [Candidatus Altiarchaeota archaeon]|nr:hypothetical protein [Candidatus Altiarchaeota archaeon]
MTKKDTAEYNAHFLVQAVISLISMAMLTMGDFGGTYYYDAYNHLYVYGYIFMFSGVLSSILILLGLGGFAYSLRFTLRNIQTRKLEIKELKKNIRNSQQGVLFTAVLAAVGAIVLAVTSWSIDWWLDIGFYGAFFGSLLVYF